MSARSINRSWICVWCAYVGFCIATATRFGVATLGGSPRTRDLVLLAAGAFVLVAAYARRNVLVSPARPTRRRSLLVVWMSSLAAAALAALAAHSDAHIGALLGLLASGSILAMTPPKVLGTIR